jgi:hypothetical protein
VFCPIYRGRFHVTKALFSDKCPLMRLACLVDSIAIRILLAFSCEISICGKETIHDKSGIGHDKSALFYKSSDAGETSTRSPERVALRVGLAFLLISSIV